MLRIKGNILSRQPFQTFDIFWEGSTSIASGYFSIKDDLISDKAQLKEKFKLFSKFGDKSADGSTIKLSQSDKWFKQAGVIQTKGVSTTDTGIAFRKVSK